MINSPGGSPTIQKLDLAAGLCLKASALQPLARICRALGRSAIERP